MKYASVSAEDPEDPFSRGKGRGKGKGKSTDGAAGAARLAVKGGAVQKLLDSGGGDGGGGGGEGGGGGGGGGSGGGRGFFSANTFKAIALFTVIGGVGYAVWTVWQTFNSPRGPPAPSAPPNPPGAPLRTSGSPCCIYDWLGNAASNCHDWVCEPGGSGFGVGGNGKCGDWDGHNDYHTFGTHGSRYAAGEEYRAYLDTEWTEYNLSHTAGNTTTRYLEVNGTYYPWESGDDWKYVSQISNPVLAHPTAHLPSL